MSNDYDVIIIGSGAGGGTLAYRLAPSGKRVLIVERGDYVRRELENWSSKEVFGNARYKTMEEWICQDGTTFHPGQHYYVGPNEVLRGDPLPDAQARLRRGAAPRRRLAGVADL